MEATPPFSTSSSLWREDRGAQAWQLQIMLAEAEGDEWFSRRSYDQLIAMIARGRNPFSFHASKRRERFSYDEVWSRIRVLAMTMSSCVIIASLCRRAAADSDAHSPQL
jgi:hypothetical protein